MSQELGPNTDVLTVRKGQDVTMTTREVSLGLLPSGSAIHAWPDKATSKYLQSQWSYTREQDQHVLPAVTLNSYFFALHFPFCSFPCSLLLLCENRGVGN